MRKQCLLDTVVCNHRPVRLQGVPSKDCYTVILLIRLQECQLVVQKKVITSHLPAIKLVGKVKHCQLEPNIGNQESSFSNKGSKHSLGVHGYIHSPIYIDPRP